jgi:hypothetical protein
MHPGIRTYNREHPDPLKPLIQQAFRTVSTLMAVLLLLGLIYAALSVAGR